MQFPRQTFLAVLAIVVLMALPEFVPALAPYRMFSWQSANELADLKPSRWAPPRPTAEAVYKPPVNPRPTRAPRKANPTFVEPLTDVAQGLAAFYEAIERIERAEPNTHVRIAHYGDSPTTADLITADIRSLLQKRYGDSGHGFHLMAKPWAWYGHRGVDIDSSGWEIEASNLVSKKDGYYGYGGVSFRGAAGSRTRFRLKESGTTHVEVAYKELPSGGLIVLEACGARIGAHPTDGEGASGFAPFVIPADCRDVTVRIESGPVRLFGVDFLKSTPGIVYDSLGLNGAYTSVLTRFFSAEHWGEQLQHYSPDLIVINYGTNESVFAAYVDNVFEKELRLAIKRIRAALPGKSILLMSPMDRGERDSSGTIQTVPALERVVAIEKRVAEEEGVAFFNTFEAMGGNGTMRKWYTSEPRLVGADFIHPMPGGARIIGDLLFKAILDGYNRFKTGKRVTEIAANL